ncbi:unnamed protein product, partial [Laminaria digitata]
ARGVHTKLHCEDEEDGKPPWCMLRVRRSSRTGSASFSGRDASSGNGRQRAAIMRPSSTLDAFGLALGVALLSLHVGEAFLCPTAVLGGYSTRESMTGTVDKQQQQQQQRRRLRAVGRMALGGEEGGREDDGGLLPCALPLENDASGTARKGPLRRLKSLVGRKAVTAAAVSSLLSAGTPGRAEALFGRGKTPEAPPVPALEQRLQEGAEALEGVSEGLADAAGGLVTQGQQSEGDAGAVVDGTATGLLAEAGV